MVNFLAPANAGRRQYRLFFLAVALLFLPLLFADHAPFSRFLGAFNPALALILSAAGGILLLVYLESTGAFRIFEFARYGRFLEVMLAGSAFGIVVIAADSIIVFSADINVPFPHSLVLYPVIGFIVEIWFHAAPAALLVAIARRVFPATGMNRIAAGCLAAVAFVEPVFQAVTMSAGHAHSAGAITFVGIHVLLINLVSMHFFRKYDFLTMYSFRLWYYLIWHVAWGHARLSVLFG